MSYSPESLVATSPSAAAALFFLTLYRFHYRQWTLLFQFASLTFAMGTASYYHTRSRFFMFVFYW
jgi:hypothetical protein